MVSVKAWVNIDERSDAGLMVVAMAIHMSKSFSLWSRGSWLISITTNVFKVVNDLLQFSILLIQCPVKNH